MEPMSIACTTCQARLKIRDQRAIGQILPCPRCRSMVHVSAERIKTESQWQANSVAALPPSYSLPELPPSDSFDHIDQLLDGTIQIRRVKRNSGASRWRTGNERTAAGRTAPERPLSDQTEGLAAPQPLQVPRSASPMTRAVSAPPASPSADGTPIVTPVTRISPAEEVAASAWRSGTSPLEAHAAFPPIVPSDSRWSLDHEIRSEMAALERSAQLPRLHPEAQVVSSFSVGPLPKWTDEPITREDVAFLNLPAPSRWWDTRAFRLGLLATTAVVACGTLVLWSHRDTSAKVAEPTVVESSFAETPPIDKLTNDAAEDSSNVRAEVPAPNDLPEAVEETVERSGHAAPSVPASSEPPKPPTPIAADANERSAEARAEELPLEPTRRVEPVSEATEGMADQTPPTTSTDSQVIAADDELSQLARWLKQPTATPPATLNASSSDHRHHPPMVNDDARDAGTQEQLDEQLLVPTRPLPARVDVDARLKMSLSACRFQGTPLVDVLRSLSDLSTIPITLDPDALGRVGQSCERPVQLDLRNVTLRSALEGALRESKLGYQVHEGQLRIVTADEQSQTMVTVRHDVNDLTKGEPRACQALATWMTQLIAFGSWQSQAKTDAGQNELDPSLMGNIEVEGAILQVTHRDGIQFQVVALLDKLRAARGLPKRGELTDDQTRIGGVTSAFTRFDRPITIQAWRGSTLHRVLEQLEQQADVRILVDWESLHEMGWAPNDEWKFFCREMALRSALPRLLNGTGLSYRIVDGQTLQIVSTPALMDRHDVELYSLRREGLNASGVQKFCLKLAEQLGRDKFQPQGRGALAYDAQSQHLVVSLPQRDQETVQARIVEWLAENQTTE